MRRLAEWKGTPLFHGTEPHLGDGTFSRDEEYDKLAGLVRGSLDMGLIYQMAGLEMPHSQD